MPLITALMTTYNSAAHLKETIDSILNQSFTDFEFLILDDGSSDHSVELIKSYADKRIRLVAEQQNKGVGARLRQALSLVETPYIAKIDSDDISVPERFEKQLNYLQQNPDLDIIKSYFSYFPDNAEVAQSERYKHYKAVKEKEHNAVDTESLIQQHLPRWNCIIHTTYFAKSQVIKAVGYPEHRIGEDYSLFYRALESGYRIGCIPEFLTQMRVSNFSVTTRTDTAQNYVDALVQLKKNKIDKLCKNHAGVWIFGCGGLGKETALALHSAGYTVHGFLDRENKADIELNQQLYPVVSIESAANKGIIVAAQPVRMEIVEKLQNKGLVEWQDFMVIA